jgi:hypothetical protein
MVGAIINGVATRVTWLPLPLLDEGRGRHILPNGNATVSLTLLPSYQGAKTPESGT